MQSARPTSQDKQSIDDFQHHQWLLHPHTIVMLNKISSLVTHYEAQAKKKSESFESSTDSLIHLKFLLNKAQTIEQLLTYARLNKFPTTPSNA